MANERLPERSTFIPIVHAGWRGTPQVESWRVRNSRGGLPLRPTPTPAGDSPRDCRLEGVADSMT